MRSFFRIVGNLHRVARILISLAVGVLVFLFTFRSQTTAFAFMISWIGFAVCALFFFWVTILGLHPVEIATIASEQDASYLFIFGIVVAAAFTSLFAIIGLLHGLPTFSKKGLDVHIILSAIAVALSWVLIHTLFTVRYAHMYYTLIPSGEGKTTKYAGGLIFPGTELPDFLDFAYYSFVLGMTFQVADVSISDRDLRRLALIHGFLSFVYNTAIIALSINIVSGMIGK